MTKKRKVKIFKNKLVEKRWRKTWQKKKIRDAKITRQNLKEKVINWKVFQLRIHTRLVQIPNNILVRLNNTKKIKKKREIENKEKVREKFRRKGKK